MVGTHSRCTRIASCVLLLALSDCDRAEPNTQSNPVAPILLFNGTGTSLNDVRAIATVLETRNWPYETADSGRMNGLSESQLAAYRLLIVAGGNYVTMGNELSPETTRRIHNAVQRGVNYLGICAGGLLAGDSTSNGLNLTAGVKFGFYSLVNRGMHKAAVTIVCAQAPVIEHYWEDGPEFTGWGWVVGKYPDGTPAIVEGAFGKGWVILCGVHPEAPAKWRRDMTFSTTPAAANEYAGTLIDAALNARELPHF